MGEQEEIPLRTSQREIVSSLLSKKSIEGEKWYLVDRKWMSSLKQFIGIFTCSDVANPGPIDNNNLLDGNRELKKGLIEDINYELVPEEAWILLTKWYGLTSGQEPIARMAVKTGTYSNFTIVEVYELDLRCVFNFNYEKEEKIRFSKATSINEVDKHLRCVFNISNDAKTRIWQILHHDKTELLTEGRKTIQDVSLNEHQLIIIEAQNPDGSWPKESGGLVKVISTLSTAGPSNTIIPMPGISPILSPRSTRQMTPSTSQPPRLGGLCGLLNLGNTCFMNSVLQCMSNCPPVTEYFLSGKHLEELNETNPLGMKGEIAKAYGELIDTMWRGKHAYTVPQKFQVQVGKFNPSFCGCQQHDSQELLTFLLDGLHEDLNRIITKPYITVKDACGRDDLIIAKETWDNYRKRNDSIIVDTFHGLLKSRVICPECERLSVTFDPFCYLSLPLPLKKDRHITVRYIPYEGAVRESMHRLTVPKKGTIRDLCIEVSLYTYGNPDHMLVAEITYCHFHRFFGNSDSLDSIEEKDVIYVFQLSVIPNPLDCDWMIFPVCFWESCSPNEQFEQKRIFGVPFLVVLQRQPITTDSFSRIIIEKMQRHFIVDSFRTIINGDYGLDSIKGQEYNNIQATFKLYSIDTSLYVNPEPVFPVEGIYNFPEILFGKIPDQVFGRRALLLQFSTDQKRELYNEKPADIITCSTPSKERAKISIHDCLRLFTTCEKLSADDAWYCPSCKKHQRATKKFDLWTLPKILIIHLKRFSYTRYRRDKIDALVDFPLNDLNMDEYIINKQGPNTVYDLVGVCNHYGNMGGGHYTAFCKNKINNQWHCFDDEHVTQTTQESIVSPASYVLFYIAKPLKSASPIDEDCMDIN